MKSFDILVNGRLIQSDLIVVNLPIRNDIAAYYRLDLDSKLVNHIIAEKAMFPVDKVGSVALNAEVDTATTKYEIVNAYPVVLNSSADFDALFMLGLEENKLEIQQELQEVSQKIERASVPISIGADDMLVVVPLKTLGDFYNATELDATASEVKNSLIRVEEGRGGLTPNASLTDPLATYYDEATGGMVPGAEVQSLSYLLHMRLIKSNVGVDANVVEFEYHRSLGRASLGVAVGTAAVSFNAEFFVDLEGGVELFSSAETFSHKFTDSASESSVVLNCTGTAVLRRMRLVSEIDALGSLADIDEMTLEEMYYVDIDE